MSQKIIQRISLTFCPKDQYLYHALLLLKHYVYFIEYLWLSLNTCRVYSTNINFFFNVFPYKHFESESKDVSLRIFQGKEAICIFRQCI